MFSIRKKPSQCSTRGTFAVAAVAALMISTSARAQTPTLPSTTPPADFTSIAGGPATFSEPTFTQPAPAAPSYFAGEGAAPTAPRVEMSLLGTITDSLFGDVYAAGRWRPLSLGTFFSEGWLEPWAGAPAGQDDLTPRHGWLGAFDGVFYRLWLAGLSYSNSLNQPYHGNSYTGFYQIFLPFSRRFELSFYVPFVTSNGTQAPGAGIRRNSVTSRSYRDSCFPRPQRRRTSSLWMSALQRAAGPPATASWRCNPGMSSGGTREDRGSFAAGPASSFR